MNEKDGNRLQNETSPYLLQHASNPVDWYPWGEEALELAKTEDKLIFLSIGYSTCHWCHVMERESFEDDEVAELMNRVFVSIKVDREERPDLDAYYMDAAYLLNRSGGWPLNVILTPNGTPFFAATYIPKKGTSFSSGMLGIIPRLEEMWRDERKKILASAESILEALRRTNTETDRPLDTAGADELEKQAVRIVEGAVEKAASDLKSSYDPVWGGFSREPKFPQPHNILFLLRYWNSSGDGKSMEMVENTLRKMRAGGMYDHLGFGFHRYSTDREWRVPHFEKMLYDQGMTALRISRRFRRREKRSMHVPPVKSVPMF